MSEAIVITSGKGGAGKSLLTAGLAVHLAAAGKKVVAVDMDVGLRSLDVLFQVQNHVVYDVADVLDGVCTLKQAIMKSKVYPGVALINAPQFGDSSSISTEGMDDLTEKLKKQCDYILFDCPAGIGRGFHNSIVSADRAIVVTIPETICLRDAERAIGLFEAKGMDRIDIVLNRVRPEHMKKDGGAARAEEMLNRAIFGAVPEDVLLSCGNAEGRPIDLSDRISGKSFERISRRLTGDTVPVEYPKFGWKQKLRAILR